MIRRWAHQAGESWRKFGDPVMGGQPKDYGAVADGVTDDTAAYQAWIDATAKAYDEYGWFVRPLLFWALCIDLGALGALWVR